MNFPGLQPRPLQVNAGDDKIINPGGSALLGGNPAANFGNPNYSYLWYPSYCLNNTAIANPTASPLNTTMYILSVTDSKGCTNTDTVKVIVNSSSVDNIFTAEDIEIIQDRTKGNLTVVINNPHELVNHKIYIYNLIGQVIYSENLPKITGRYSMQINFSNNPKGVYILKIDGRGTKVCKKFSLN
ncbi:MAG: T9SS type A sorting domain-containing protein [Bacteroidia bacterium]|nr:T9SS type A sorting domain-containing protein [Bacteroidia bacterium]